MSNVFHQNYLLDFAASLGVISSCQKSPPGIPGGLDRFHRVSGNNSDGIVDIQKRGKKKMIDENMKFISKSGLMVTYIDGAKVYPFSNCRSVKRMKNPVHTTRGKAEEMHLKPSRNCKHGRMS